MEKKKIEKHKNRLFGRNLFTLIFAIVAILIIAFAVTTIQSYTSTSSKTKVVPFETKNLNSTDNTFTEGTYNTTNDKNNTVIRMNGKDFNEIGLFFSCKEYNEDKGSAKYELKMYFNDNTPEEIKYNTKFQANVCMSAKWIGFVSYATKTSTIKINTPYYSNRVKNVNDINKTYYVEDNTSRFGYREATEEEINDTNVYKYENTLSSKDRTEQNTSISKNTFTINNVVDFPAKANTWPIKIKVSEPTIYLYLSYSYNENAITKTKTYILKYSYKELMTSDTSGAIRD